MTDYIEVSRSGLDRISGKATNCFKQNFKSIENDVKKRWICFVIKSSVSRSVTFIIIILEHEYNKFYKLFSSF